jgi:hypothetical protein
VPSPADVHNGLVTSGPDPNPGVPFVLEVPAFASVHLQVVSPAGEKLATATGFVVQDRHHVPHLITNRHVVTGQNWETGAIEGIGVAPSALVASFPRQGGGMPWVQVVLPLGDEGWRPLWREHPRHGPLVDVVALPLTSGVQDGQVDLVTYPLETDYARLDLTGELYVIGYPLNVDPAMAGGLLGIWMRGSIAWPPQLDWRGLPCMLLDCRTRDGQSGSPVIFWADATKTFVGPHQRVQTGPPAAPTWNLVGVYSGRIHKDSDIGMVWKRSAVEQIVAAGQPPSPDVLVMPLEGDPLARSHDSGNPDSAAAR